MRSPQFARSRYEVPDDAGGNFVCLTRPARVTSPPMIQGKDVGDALVEPALAPIRKASSRLRDGAIAEGLAGFAKTELLAGLKNGIQNAASNIGFPIAEVEKLFDWDTLLPALDRLSAAQTAAWQAFHDQAVSVGGLLTGLSRGTAVDVYRESGALALRNVAQRFVRDKQLFTPLDALASEISAWEALIAQCGDIIEHSPLVARSLKRRFMLRIAGAGAALILVVVGLVVWWSEKKIKDARARIEAAINDADACKVESIAAEDAPRATPDQSTRVNARKQVCTEKRAIAAHEAACETLARNFAAGKLTPEDKTQAKTAATLLERAVKSELSADDLLLTPKEMPCLDAPAKTQFFPIFAKYAAQSSGAWTTATHVSDDIRKALESKELKTIPAWRDELTRRSEPQAAKAILSGKPDDMNRARAACEFQNSFGIELGKKCSGLLAFMASRKL